MPFGLCNAPATFQRLMDLVLAGAKWSTCLVYLDDIVTIGKTFHQHLTNVRDVLDKLRQAGLRLKPGKCTFFQEEVTYLGHIVSARGVATDHTKTEKVATWPEPKTLAEVQGFLGLASYYRRFIKNFAAIAKPLHRLTGKGHEFCWTEACADAFKELKHRLTTAPFLAFPDYNLPFILDTDATGTGIGAVLSQVQEGEERVVAYASRTLSKQARRYCVTRREPLAVVTFIRHFRHYLHTQLIVRNGMLYRQHEDEHGSGSHLQLVVPRQTREEILQDIHGGVVGGHLGEKKTLSRLKERFYWPGQSEEVKRWCQNCPSCARKKTVTPKNRAPLQTMKASYPMQRVAVDIVGPFPETDRGNLYVLVAADYFTRWVEAYAIPYQEAATVASKLVDEMFCHFSIPEQLHSDQGRQFESSVMQEVGQILQIHKIRTTPYNPQSDGLVE